MSSQRHIHEQLAELRESLFNSPLNVLWSETPFSVKIQIKKSLAKLNRPEQVVPNNPIIGCSPNSLARCDKCEHMSIAFRQAQQESRMIIETLEAARMEATERINVLAGDLAVAESEKLRFAEEAEMAREELISQLEHLKSELSQANSKLSAIGNERKNDLERTDSAKKDFEKNLEQIKSELSQRNLQLKAKNKSLNDYQIQSNQVVAEHERARSELTKKVDNLLRKNSNLQSLLDESKKKLKEERASHKKKRKGKDKAIQVDVTVTANSEPSATATTVPAAVAAAAAAATVPAAAAVTGPNATVPATSVIAATTIPETAEDNANIATATDPKLALNDTIPLGIIDNAIPTNIVGEPPAATAVHADIANTALVSSPEYNPKNALTQTAPPAADPAAPAAAAPNAAMDAPVEETTKDTAADEETPAWAVAMHVALLSETRSLREFANKLSQPQHDDDDWETETEDGDDL